MKKLISFLIAIMLCLLPMAVFAEEPVKDTGVTINVYNWGEYIANGTDGSLDINEEFTKRTGIKVNYTTFDSNESLYSKLAGGGADYDVIIPSDYMVAKLREEGFLAEINFDNIPNAEYIDDNFLNPNYDPENKFSVPYTWGVVGIFYNTNFIDEVTGWDALWDEQYEGKILMFDNPRDSFSIAQVMLGFSMNSTNQDELDEAAALLKQQKPLVQAYVMDQIFDKMAGGEAWLAPYYSGDAAVLVDSNDNIEFVIPEEGTNYFVDAMCIPATSTKKEYAEAYINFLCEPEIAAENVDYIGYATPESAAKEYLDEEIVENPIFYPGDNILENTEVFTNLPEETSLYMDRLWAEVKMGGPGESFVLVLIILAFLGVYIAIAVYKKKKRKKGFD